MKKNSVERAQYKCKQCGREFGGATLRCPERAFDRCPYEKRDLRPLLQRLPFKRILFFASIWLLLWFLSGVSRVRFVEEHSFSRVLFYILFLIVLVFGGISGFFIILTRLHNPKSKEIWKRIVLLGIPLKSTFITGGSLLPLEFTFRNPLIYPPSVVEYFHVINREYSDLWDQVVDVLSSGILGLLANGTIQVRQCERFSS